MHEATKLQIIYPTRNQIRSLFIAVELQCNGICNDIMIDGQNIQKGGEI